MNHNNFIEEILTRRDRFIISNEYTERHHIIPKCMGGSDLDNNLIDLYPDEHFTAHKLLAIENPTNYKIVSAWRVMCLCTAAKTNKRWYEVTPEDYKICRILWSDLHSNYMKQLAYDQKKLKLGIFSDESHEKSRLSRIGIKIKASEHRKNAIGNAIRGRTYFNNGIENVFTFDCPDGYVPGRIINYDDSNRLNIIKKNQCKKVICLDTMIIYNSLGEASEMTGASHIGSCCKGKLKSSGGLHWLYYSDYLDMKDRSELEEDKPEVIEESLW